LLRDKGVVEFVEAAHLLRNRGYSARFVLAGQIDLGNPSSLTPKDVINIERHGIVEVWGYSSKMPELLGRANIVVLPSYREGMPKVLLEAAACGRPIVTTDVPGCRDAIRPGISGLLVPAYDSELLADAIGFMLNDPDSCKAMGNEGRLMAEKEFNITDVVQRHLDIYNELVS
jgi:glycosyltransferase involved in cell wall biosynthesis